MFDENSRLNSLISACRHCSSWFPRMAFAYVKGDPSGAKFRDDTADADAAVVLLRVTGGSGRVFNSVVFETGKGIFGAVASVGSMTFSIRLTQWSDCAALFMV